MQDQELEDVQTLIERWERGEDVWSDPPLCAALIDEIRRLRRLLTHAAPYLAGTVLEEAVFSECTAKSAEGSAPHRGRHRLVWRHRRGGTSV